MCNDLFSVAIKSVSRVPGLTTLFFSFHVYGNRRETPAKRTTDKRQIRVSYHNLSLRLYHLQFLFITLYAFQGLEDTKGTYGARNGHSL